MTQEELDALPEVGGFDVREEIRDGKLVRIPVMRPMFALYFGPDDPLLVQDIHGEFWSVGWAGGKQYKVRRRSPL